MSTLTEANNRGTDTWDSLPSHSGLLLRDLANPAEYRRIPPSHHSTLSQRRGMAKLPALYPNMFQPTRKQPFRQVSRALRLPRINETREERPNMPRFNTSPVRPGLCGCQVCQERQQSEETGDAPRWVDIELQHKETECQHHEQASRVDRDIRSGQQEKGRGVLLPLLFSLAMGCVMCAVIAIIVWKSSK